MSKSLTTPLIILDGIDFILHFFSCFELLVITEGGPSIYRHLLSMIALSITSLYRTLMMH